MEALGIESVLLGQSDQGVLMAGLVELMERLFLQDMVIPTDELNRLVDVQKELVGCTIPFCKSLVLGHLMQRDPPPKLVKFSKDYIKEFVDYRRRFLLNKAREILTENDYHNTVTLGKEEIRDGVVEDYDENDAELDFFDLPKCSISDTANKLIALVR